MSAGLSMTTLPAPGNRLVDGIARVLLGLIFLHALLGKLTGFGAVAEKISEKGLPFAPLLLAAAVVLLAVGSVLVVTGWRSRIGAILLLIFLIPTSFIFHGNVGDLPDRIQLLKNLSSSAGCCWWRTARMPSTETPRLSASETLRHHWNFRPRRGVLSRAG
jgi:putative oxidoreductase